MNEPVAVSSAPSAGELTIPKVRRIAFDAPLKWLRLGWADLWRQPAASLFYGIVIAVGGAVILGLTATLPYLFAAAVTGFLLVAPMLGAGLYELSRRYLANEPVTIYDSMGPGSATLRRSSASASCRYWQVPRGNWCPW